MIVPLAATLAARAVVARERAHALARWDNEGGAPPIAGRRRRRAAQPRRFNP
jgi:hypothetical protein